ncbi:MAG: IS1634 family transposase [Candidatus Heimdallarchaeota archaeon]|nr:MAG: IS1634 family transposase [Candidatus Heimdallarchaeota archaeon]
MLTVQKYYEYLGLSKVLGIHKKKGIDLNSLIKALLSYKLTENLSITKASDWINRDEVLKAFHLEPFEQRTLYRTLEIMGENREQIMADIQDILFNIYDFEHTNINMDWTSFVLFGNKCPLGKRGYSRDHRPDKKQITVGLSELSKPINVPIGMTVREGNIHDQVHFVDTFEQVKDHLKEDSIIVMDQGANRKENLESIESSKLKFVTSRQLNKSDEITWIKNFDKSKAELVDDRYGIYGQKKIFPSRINYLYFSEKLYRDQIETKLRKVDKLFKEAELIQQSIDSNRGLPKRYKINNPLIDCEYSYQTKLTMMSEEQAKELLKKASITGREGFFCIVSNKDLTLKKALETYRLKDSIEKIFNSLKNEIEIRPLRVWSDYSIYGALLIGFLAQLIISLIRFEHKELKHISPKFIKYSLMNLTVTVEFYKNSSKRYIFSNFNPISEVILVQNQAII